MIMGLKPQLPAKCCGSYKDRRVSVVKISRKTMPSVDRLKLTVLVEDSASIEKPDLIAKHGLSLLIEASVAGTYLSILMDAGPPPDMALHNAQMINADLQKLDAIIISHGHYDHVGGLLKILERINQSIPVVAHPRTFDPKFVYKPSLKFIGSEVGLSSVSTAGGALLLSRNSVKIMNGIITSGEVVRETNFEKTEGFWTVEDGQFIEDPILDDQALLINVREKGLVVIAGCAHSGIINTVKHAQKITEINDVYAIIGGFHLAKADNMKIQASVDELMRINPKLVYPCHCTGPKAINQFLNSFGDRCRPIHTGDIIRF